jgi:hypothetical protein
MTVKIAMCDVAQAPALMRFIDRHWKKNHALSVDRRLLDWQHLDPASGQYNFVLGCDANTGEIVAALGFIPQSQFDPALAGAGHLWLALWKVRDDVRVGGLGLNLVSFLVETRVPKTIGVIGMNPLVEPIYRAIGFKTGIVNHYYLVNKSLARFHLLDSFDGRFGAEGAERGGGEFIGLDATSLTAFGESLDRKTWMMMAPGKSLEYLKNRYLLHPHYRYGLYGVVVEHCPVGIAVFRECRHEGGRALRLVDYIGDPYAFSCLNEAMNKLLESTGVEYVDFYNWGIDPQVMAASGFIRRGTDSPVVVPNYFEPFSRENVDLRFGWRSGESTPFYFFKGDSDQDRPNMLPIPVGA